MLSASLGGGAASEAWGFARRMLMRKGVSSPLWLQEVGLGKKTLTN